MKLDLLRQTDARFFQIAFLTIMLGVGILIRDFPITLAAAATCVGTCLLVQIVAIFLKQVPWSSLLSATISGISLCLLCRSQSLLMLALASASAIGSKFVFTWKRKHFFNPTCFGIVLMLLVSDHVWISPAQWGENTVLACWLSLMGIAVVHSAWRYDISFAFLAAYASLLAGRISYLGQPWPVFWHQFTSGSLILFTFFMISDPRSTPDHRYGRIGFGVATAALAYVLRFHFYQPQSLLFALFILSPLTIVFDSLWKDYRFQWSAKPGNLVAYEKKSRLFGPQPAHVT